MLARRLTATLRAPSALRLQTAFLSTEKGTCKWFDSKKGFGFITPDDGGDDVFVHQSVIHATGYRSLAEGEPVEFEIVQGPNGKTNASSVTGPDGAYVQGSDRAPPGRARDEY